MIHIDLFYQEGLYHGFKSQGHAIEDKDSAVICSAVSVLVFTITNTLISKGKEVEIKELDEEKGLLHVCVQEPKQDDVQLLFETLKIGLLSIYENYPDEVAIFIKEETC